MTASGVYDATLAICPVQAKVAHSEADLRLARYV
jgi:hypothetical protein